MRIILPIVVAIALTQCDIPDVNVQINDFHSGLQDEQKTYYSRLQRVQIETPPESFLTSKQFLRHIENKDQEAEMKSNSNETNFGKSILKINSERNVGRHPFKSDNISTETQAEQIFKNVEGRTRIRRQVLRDHRYPATTWEDGVFYTFNTSDHILQRIFKLGAKLWSESTCIDFVEDRNARVKLVIIKGNESQSRVGRAGGDQILRIGEKQLTVWSALHEIGHALGLFHTMQRYDRDNYIKILMQNLNPIYNMEYEKTDESFTNVYGLTYDYGSIMHYGELSCSTNSQPTVAAIEAYYQKTMGSQIISFSDFFMINEHYGCNERCSKTTSAKCANEGYPHPRNCSICICPLGYGGARCDRRPPGCGNDLVATREKQTVIYELGFGSTLRDEFSFCNYMITATGGKKIEVDVRSVSHGYDLPGCPKGGVEVKAQKDQKLTGYRFCSMNGSGGPILSSSNRLPVILFNRFGKMQATFTYRLVY